MDEVRIDRAVSRIEAALDRVEQAATGAAQMPVAGKAPDGERDTRVRAALAQLDALIESLEQ